MEKNKLIKLIGSRMKEAREINNLTQVAAAKLLFGHDNSSYLSKIESGNYAKEMGQELLSIILKAAKAYEVSSDFLLGLSEEWEREPVLAIQKNIEGWMLQQQQRYLSIEINAIRDISNRQFAIETGINQLLPIITRCHQAIDVFKQNYPKFESLPKFSPVCFGVQSTFEKAGEVKRTLQKFHADTGTIKQGSRQLLPLIEMLGLGLV